MAGQKGENQYAPDERVRNTASVDHVDALSHTLAAKDSLHIIQEQMKGGGAKDEAMLKSLGLPSNPFDKEWTDPGEKGGQKLIHQIEQALGMHHSVEDKAREREISSLTPKQKEAYDAEESALRNYELGANINGKRPDTPLHDQIEQNVGKFEQQCKDKALASLTPEQRQQYEAEQQAQRDAFKQWLKHPEQAMPDTPHKISDLVDQRTQQNAEKDLNDHPNTGFHPGFHPHNPTHPGFHPGKHTDVSGQPGDGGSGKTGDVTNSDGSVTHSDGSTTHTGVKPQDNYTEKTENGKNVKKYANGVSEETDPRTGTVDVHLPNGDSIHILKNGDSTYASAHPDGRKHYTQPFRTQHDALEHAREKYEFPEPGRKDKPLLLKPGLVDPKWFPE